MHKVAKLILATAIYAPFGIAQQATNQQTAAPPFMPPRPCVPAQQTSQKYVRPGVPPWLRNRINKVQNQTGTGIDANRAVHDATTPTPCPAHPPNQKPLTSALPDTAQKPVINPTTANKTTTQYICPPKSSLIPGYPYCVFPDHSTVDAIPLPAATPAPAVPAATQKPNN